MPPGITIKCKRKASNFAAGELAAGEWGLNTNSGAWFFSTDGLAVTALPTGGTVNISQTEIDFGTTPVSEASFLITDAAVSPSSQLIGSVAYEAPTGKDLDELEMDALDLKFAPGSGNFTLYAAGLNGYIADRFKINYLIG